MKVMTKMMKSMKIPATGMKMSMKKMRIGKTRKMTGEGEAVVEEVHLLVAEEARLAAGDQAQDVDLLV
jgi:hypothetical protein